jgi:hypothetical protein
MADREQKTLQLMEMSGGVLNLETASAILSNCGWDLEQAVTVCFDSESLERPSNASAMGAKEKKKQKSLSARNANPRGKKAMTAQVCQLPPVPTQAPPPEKVIVAGNDDRFKEFRAQAQAKNRWLFVQVTVVPPKIPIQQVGRLRDYFNCTFVPLSMTKDEPVGLWFCHFYKVDSWPFYGIIDPLTGELKKRFDEWRNEALLDSLLRKFLIDNSEKGLPIDLELAQSEITSSDLSDQDADIQENDESLGDLVAMMIQLPDGKRSKLEIRAKAKVGSLYKKVESLLGKKAAKFKLMLPFAELAKMEETIEEAKCKSALIRVVEC